MKKIIKNNVTYLTLEKKKKKVNKKEKERLKWIYDWDAPHPTDPNYH